MSCPSKSELGDSSYAYAGTGSQACEVTAGLAERKQPTAIVGHVTCRLIA